MSTLSSLKQKLAQLDAWRNAFPGKTPEEVRQMMATASEQAQELGCCRFEIDQLKRERDEHNSALDAHEEEADSLHGIIADYQTKLAKAEAACAQLGQQWEAANKAFNAEHEAREALQKQCAALRDIVSKLKSFVPCSLGTENLHDEIHDALSSSAGTDYISRAQAEAETLEAVRPLVTALERIRKAGQHLVGGALFDSHSGSIAADALTHARDKFPKLFE